MSHSWSKRDLQDSVVKTCETLQRCIDDLKKQFLMDDQPKPPPPPPPTGLTVEEMRSLGLVIRVSLTASQATISYQSSEETPLTPQLFRLLLICTLCHRSWPFDDHKLDWMWAYYVHLDELSEGKSPRNNFPGQISALNDQFTAILGTDSGNKKSYVIQGRRGDRSGLYAVRLHLLDAIVYILDDPVVHPEVKAAELARCDRTLKAIGQSENYRFKAEMTALQEWICERPEVMIDSPTQQAIKITRNCKEDPGSIDDLYKVVLCGVFDHYASSGFDLRVKAHTGQLTEALILSAKNSNPAHWFELEDVLRYYRIWIVIILMNDPEFRQTGKLLLNSMARFLYEELNLSINPVPIPSDVVGVVNKHWLEMKGWMGRDDYVQLLQKRIGAALEGGSH